MRDKFNTIRFLYVTVLCFFHVRAMEQLVEHNAKVLRPIVEHAQLIVQKKRGKFLFL